MVVKIKNRHRLKEKEVKDLLASLRIRFQGNLFNEKSTVDIGTIEEFKVLLVDDSIDFIMHNNDIVFTLQGVNKYQLQNRFVVVDMGAIGFITKGADVMAPGIKDADPGIQKYEYVWVCDERYRKPLAVGVALMTGEEMKISKTGKAIKTLYYVGDRLWILTHE